MTTETRMSMTPEEEAIAAEFEQGWSAEQIAAATTRLDPAAAGLLPAYLTDMLHQRAQDEGISELSLLRKAVETYLIPA